MTSLAVIQSSYIPWKGYFDVVDRVDEFVLYDHVQFTKNDWRNRNLIKTHKGTTWLTIPVLTSGRFGQSIDEVEIGDLRWARKHWSSITTNYARATHFDDVGPRLAMLYERAAGLEWLSQVNELFLRGICDLLDIGTRITRSSHYSLPDDRNGRLVALCEAVGADTYLSGPAAKAYLDTAMFERNGIRVEWMSYEGYPPYRQLHGGEFVHHVSILDLLLNEGAADARSFMLGGVAAR